MEEGIPLDRKTFPLFHTQHARRRMVERNIAAHEVQKVVHQGKTLRTYPEDDGPRGSYLRYLKVPDHREVVNPEINELEEIDIESGKESIISPLRPIHVVASDRPSDELTHVITVYEPDPDEWEDDFQWKKEWSSTKNTWRE